MSDGRDREWRLIREESRDGPTNMALDEVAARTAVEEGIRTVRVYRWDPGTLSLGYGQDPESVDWAFCDREGITVTRRPTGGGGIYHDDWGDISYTIVAPADELPGNLMACYERLCEPIVDAFSRMGVDADFADRELPEIHHPACYLREVHPAHDVLAGGRKISGNAQYRQRDAVIQHGSLSYGLVPHLHLGVFADHDVDEATFRDRVTSIREESGIDRETAVAAVEESLREWSGAEAGAWSEDELAFAGELVDAKYGNDRWVRDREDPT